MAQIIELRKHKLFFDFPYKFVDQNKQITK